MDPQRQEDRDTEKWTPRDRETETLRTAQALLTFPPERDTAGNTPSFTRPQSHPGSTLVTQACRALNHVPGSGDWNSFFGLYPYTPTVLLTARLLGARSLSFSGAGCTIVFGSERSVALREIYTEPWPGLGFLVSYVDTSRLPV